MDVMSLATELNLVGKLVYNVLYEWIAGWGIDSELIGAFGVTVILFTVFLTLLTMPLDIWQKMIARSNSRKMRLMKPELDKLNKLYESDKNTLMIKQRELYKKYKYSTFKTCLPTLATLVIFMVVFSGFNSAVRYHNSVVYERLKETYNNTYNATYLAETGAGTPVSEAGDKATEAAEAAVLNAYEPERFLLTTNIFMPDTWKDPIPDVSTGHGAADRGIQLYRKGQIGVERLSDPADTGHGTQRRFFQAYQAAGTAADGGSDRGTGQGAADSDEDDAVYHARGDGDILPVLQRGVLAIHVPQKFYVVRVEPNMEYSA